MACPQCCVEEKDRGFAVFILLDEARSPAGCLGGLGVAAGFCTYVCAGGQPLGSLWGPSGAPETVMRMSDGRRQGAGGGHPAAPDPSWHSPLHRAAPCSPRVLPYVCLGGLLGATALAGQEPCCLFPKALSPCGCLCACLVELTLCQHTQAPDHSQLKCSVCSRGLENKQLFQNKWDSSARAKERAAKRLLGVKGHTNIGLIPPSSCRQQGCSSNIPASSCPELLKGTRGCLGVTPCPHLLSSCLCFWRGAICRGTTVRTRGSFPLCCMLPCSVVVKHRAPSPLGLPQSPGCVHPRGDKTGSIWSKRRAAEGWLCLHAPSVATEPVQCPGHGSAGSWDPRSGAGEGEEERWKVYFKVQRERVRGDSMSWNKGNSQ